MRSIHDDIKPPRISNLTSGTTFRPDADCKYFRAMIVGGGGGGGGAQYGALGAGAGGGKGEVVEIYRSQGVYTYSLGAQGAAGAAGGGDGGTGGNTTFDGITAAGAAGGEGGLKLSPTRIPGPGGSAAGSAISGSGGSTQFGYGGRGCYWYLGYNWVGEDGTFGSGGGGAAGVVAGGKGGAGFVQITQYYK
jgi:hypothetical protein